MSSRVLWVVVDSLGVDHVNAQNMPWLAALASEGAMASEGGEAVMPALTYPNHASFVTGAGVEAHGITGNQVFRNGAWVGAEGVGPAVETVFDVAGAAGRSSVAVVGDQNLVGVCGAGAAVDHWPAGGVHDSQTALGWTGYAADAEVLSAALALDPAAYDLAFVQLDEMDSVQHIFGPHSEEARTMASAVDTTLEALASAYREHWDDTLVVVVSDHGQEAVGGHPIGFDGVIADALGVVAPENPHEGDPAGRWRTDGTAAWISPQAHADLGDLGELPGVESAVNLDDGSAVAWGSEGVVFGLEWGQKGDHGSIRSARQVAVVGGGHPATGNIGDVISRDRPKATQWAGIVLGVLLGTGGQP
ncbi:MAG: alkaline phosphatase family protein [Microthrixaceae bacterium]